MPGSPEMTTIARAPPAAELQAAASTSCSAWRPTNGSAAADPDPTSGSAPPAATNAAGNGVTPSVAVGDATKGRRAGAFAATLSSRLSSLPMSDRQWRSLSSNA